AEAAQRTALEAALAQTFRAWGYTQVIPPTFEFYESLAAEAGPQLREELYRFFDREGRTLALRADFTIPIARIVATKLYDQPMPLRFCYTGSVFRHEEPRAGRRREFTQAGVELIGARTPAADAEVIALAAESLRAVGLTQFRIHIGQMAFFKALIADLHLDDAQVAQLKSAVERRATVQVESILRGLPIPDARKQVLLQLTRWRHDEHWLDAARALCVNAQAHEAIDELQAVIARLHATGIDGAMSINLAELRGMEYYTGIVFAGFVPGIGYDVLSGGRYDELIGHFGKSCPAMGFAIGVERVMMALPPSEASLAHDVVAEGCAHAECYARIAEARRAGERVLVDVTGKHGGALREYAKSRGARVLLCTHKGKVCEG
ncbi:MAG: ATP phosphoribosyltransferase regulatory subunit, partial [Chloroflexi bacterium]|nr:ATP phosphoribosyltransferase regulatory subunit [Chloroflexota bacterium]